MDPFPKNCCRHHPFADVAADRHWRRRKHIVLHEVNVLGHQKILRLSSGHLISNVPWVRRSTVSTSHTKKPSPAKHRPLYFGPDRQLAQTAVGECRNRPIGFPATPSSSPRGRHSSKKRGRLCYSRHGARRCAAKRWEGGATPSGSQQVPGKRHRAPPLQGAQAQSSHPLKAFFLDEIGGYCALF